MHDILMWVYSLRYPDCYMIWVSTRRLFNTGLRVGRVWIMLQREQNLPKKNGECLVD